MIYPSDITKDEVNKLPLRGYRGNIKVVDTPKDLAVAIKELRQHQFLGFDTETKPAFQKGVYHQVALLQLAVSDCVYLIRLNKIGFSPVLRRLFSDQGIKKVGISIRDDLAELKKLSNFEPQGVVELNDVAKNLGVVREGARNLTATFLHFRISKSQQTSNWERDQLTLKQQRYAATDAWVCYQIYEKLLDQDQIDTTDLDF
ncbi:MAG: 3'-exoribonuclease [Cyclobacteriaceae bacterium]|nr:MAG: 3'-exoribonuclease [Cyclobacteriaceae bacterium]